MIEYKVELIKIDEDGSMNELENSLNVFAQKGWKLISVTNGDSYMQGYNTYITIWSVED